MSAGWGDPVAPKITLYGPLRAPYTEKCRRALILKGLDFELREPAGPEDYERWSPETGLLPVMTVGEELVSDSTNILLRLEEIRPEPPLLSADPTIAAQQRNLEDWADESFLWYWQRWQRIVDEHSASPPPPVWPRPLRRVGAWLRAGGTWERPQTALLRGVEDRMNDLVNFLGSRRFFYSDRVSMADLAVYGMLFTLSRDAIPGSARLLSSRSMLLEFMRRVEDETGG
jgi:glutathione S-transferase